MLRITQKGFSLIEVIIVVAVIAIVGFLGYTFWNNYQNSQTTEDTTTSQTDSNQDVPAAPEINSAENLDAANSALEESSIDNTNGSAALESEMSEF